ncbi:diaminopropionate ammonia-lyase [Microbacterium sp. SLBN-154]|uniref:diaminopropionate ammonia-lyase n=1 Tax=Microbacterium sp. SLBN-154 TaxID=2768458 RepID=UPI0011526417|nr:diaminopropionate ammonia-lyase [Microbacterium sp. SLBN-154]TQK17632.1 diaminopropionate ammonia-lyase [Microbacterium sp. SLBN-154]
MADSRIYIPTRRRPAQPINDGDAAARRDFHRSLPGYRATPLLQLRSLAAESGVAGIYVKDEAERLGLPAFKMLGASWATARAIQRDWAPDIPLTLDALRAALADRLRRRLAAATDGNHGRGVARMAALLDLDCDVFVPAGTADSRIADIESEGARVTVVDGTYDDTVRRSAEEADERTLVISDTSWPGYLDTPRDVIRGYATMFEEVDDALARSGLPAPTHLFVQAGVGAFAAAAISHYDDSRRSGNSRRPTTVVVEPIDADCLLRSAENDEVTEAPGPHRSTMAGLNCGLPSLLAWPTVQGGTDAYIAISDGRAHSAMRTLATEGLVSGESGAAALAGLQALLDDRAAAEQLGLDDTSVVLVVNTEGATDPVNYRSQLAEDPQATRDAAHVRRQARRVIDLSPEG